MYAAVPRITPTPVIMAGDVIVGRLRDDAATVAPVRLQRLGQPEVEHLDGAVGSHLDIRRLQVAVDDALLVCGFQRLGDLFRDRQASSNGIAPRAMRCGRASPSTSSMTRARTPPDSSSPWIVRDVRMIE